MKKLILAILVLGSTNAFAGTCLLVENSNDAVINTIEEAVLTPSDPMDSESRYGFAAGFSSLDGANVAFKAKFQECQNLGGTFRHYGCSVLSCETRMK